MAILDLNSRQEIRGTRLSVEGMHESGKSALIATAPTPNIWFVFDMGYLRALKGKRLPMFRGLKIQVLSYVDEGTGKPRIRSLEHKDWEGFDITIVKLPHPTQDGSDDVKGQRELWNFFIESCAYAAMDSDYVNTVSVDTMTLARTVKADAQIQNYQENWYEMSPADRKGRDKRVNLLQMEWKVPNDAIRDIYMNFEGAENINLIATHHLTDERVDQAVTDRQGNVKTERVLTGDKVLQGMKDTYKYVDTAIRLEMQRKMVAVGDTSRPEAYTRARFIKCAYNPDLTGSEVTDPTWNSLHNLIAFSRNNEVGFTKSKVEMPRNVTAVAKEEASA